MYPSRGEVCCPIKRAANWLPSYCTAGLHTVCSGGLQSATTKRGRHGIQRLIFRNPKQFARHTKIRREQGYLSEAVYFHIMTDEGGSGSRSGTPCIPFTFSDSSSSKATVARNVHPQERRRITDQAAFALPLTPIHSLLACHPTDRAMGRFARSITSRDISAAHARGRGMCMILWIGRVEVVMTCRPGALGRGLQ